MLVKNITRIHFITTNEKQRYNAIRGPIRMFLHKDIIERQD